MLYIVSLSVILSAAPGHDTSNAADLYQICVGNGPFINAVKSQDTRNLPQDIIEWGNNFDKMLCMIYIQSFFETVRLYGDKFGKEKICIPNDLTLGKMREMYIKYYTKHIETKTLRSTEILIKMLVDLYSCGLTL